jgi:hypothetical protein
MIKENIIEKSRKYFLSKAIDDKVSVKDHVFEAEKWAEKLLIKYPKANREVLLASVWLHDIGYFVGEKTVDHAVKSEAEADKFLTVQKIDEDMKKKILHSIRAHRNKDVKPETLEAKLMVALDSASHFTGSLYMFLFNYGKSIDYLLDKIDRDYADTGILPEIQKMLQPVYEDWRKLFEDLDNVSF